ncbi:MAG TPA: hypothetical protein VKR22_02135 [Acidimicrobiales bacterium]|nr:hypothetical protein [Acidimicrobiales bacterium]
MGTDELAEIERRLQAAGTLAELQVVVRSAPRRLVGADGATFVLRDIDMCFYVDEDAASPLWKGQRFPIERCISGWAMLNAATAIVPDITVDDRIPLDAYLPTFVRSLVMVPVGIEKPVAAIGTYWARPYQATRAEVTRLETLAARADEAIDRIGLDDAPFLKPSVRSSPAS